MKRIGILVLVFAAATRPGIATADRALEDRTESQPEQARAIYEPRRDFSASDLGVPFFPGAQPIVGGTWELSSSMDGTRQLRTLKLFTDAPVNEVAQYYREQLHVDAARSFETQSAKGKVISLSAEIENATAVNLLLHQTERGTRIEINTSGPQLP